MASLVVITGGMRFGIRMARPKCFAVNGITALSMAPSRPCRCQSSGLRMVSFMRAVFFWMTSAADRRRRGGEGLHRLIVDHCAGEVGDAGKAALAAPVLEAVEDRDHARRIAEDDVSHHHRACAGAHVFDDVLALDDA